MRMLVLLVLCCSQVRTLQGTTVADNACTGGQVFTECGSEPPITCETLMSPETTPIYPPCVARCQCPIGAPVETYLYNGSVFDRCKTVDECCEPPFVYVEHVSCSGPLTCEEVLYGRQFTCSAIPGPGCSCPPDTPVFVPCVNGEPDTCISYEDCLRPTCRTGERPTACGSPCNATCADPFPICPEVCVPRCECKTRTPFWDPDRNKCIKEAKCDPCELPKKIGPCDGVYARFYFDTSIGLCLPFTWGGCDPNANNFETLEACESTCQPCTIIDCPDTFCPAGFKTDSDGCQKNCKCNCPCKNIVCTTDKICVVDEDNQAVCVKPVCEFGQPPSNMLPPLSCANVYCISGYTCKQLDDAANCCPDSVCQLEPDSGCGGRSIQRWYFNQALNVCMALSYAGSAGNANNFLSEAECLNTCPYE